MLYELCATVLRSMQLSGFAVDNEVTVCGLLWSVVFVGHMVLKLYERQLKHFKCLSASSLQHKHLLRVPQGC